MLYYILALKPYFGRNVMKISMHMGALKKYYAQILIFVDCFLFLGCSLLSIWLYFQFVSLWVWGMDSFFFEKWESSGQFQSV